MIRSKLLTNSVLIFFIAMASGNCLAQLQGPSGDQDPVPEILAKYDLNNDGMLGYNDQNPIRLALPTGVNSVPANTVELQRLDLNANGLVENAHWGENSDFDILLDRINAYLFAEIERGDFPLGIPFEAFNDYVIPDGMDLSNDRCKRRGDCNCDGATDPILIQVGDPLFPATDVGIIVGNFEQPGFFERHQGDLTGDGKVDQADFDRWFEDRQSAHQ